MFKSSRAAESEGEEEGKEGRGGKRREKRGEEGKRKEERGGERRE